MHIIIGLIMAIAGAFWAFRHFVDAAHEGQDALRDVKGLWRKGKWARKADQRLIDYLQDPREAGAVLLYQIAAYDGSVTDAQKGQMLSEMARGFAADQQTSEELFAFARMAVGEVNDVGNTLKKVLASVSAQCTDTEKSDLLAMLEAVAGVEGAITDRQAALIADVQRQLFPV